MVTDLVEMDAWTDRHLGDGVAEIKLYAANLKVQDRGDLVAFLPIRELQEAF